MSELPNPRRHDEDDWYQIRIQGRLDERWASWFDGMQLSCDDDGTTTLQGRVSDQAALHGLLTKVRDMGLPLLGVVRGTPIMLPEQARPSDPHHRQEPRT